MNKNVCRKQAPETADQLVFRSTIEAIYHWTYILINPLLSFSKAEIAA